MSFFSKPCLHDDALFHVRVGNIGIEGNVPIGGQTPRSGDSAPPALDRRLSCQQGNCRLRSACDMSFLGDAHSFQNASSAMRKSEREEAIQGSSSMKISLRFSLLDETVDFNISKVSNKSFRILLPSKTQSLRDLKKWASCFRVDTPSRPVRINENRPSNVSRMR